MARALALSELSHGLVALGRNDAKALYLHFNGSAEEYEALTRRLGVPAYVREKNRRASWLIDEAAA